MRAAIAAIRSSGAIKAAMAEARDRVTRSQKALAALADNATRQGLCSLAEYVVRRRRGTAHRGQAPSPANCAYTSRMFGS
jgi:geranylgeranyl pyrophosphate synthase